MFFGWRYRERWVLPKCPDAHIIRSKRVTYPKNQLPFRGILFLVVVVVAVVNVIVRHSGLSGLVHHLSTPILTAGADAVFFCAGRHAQGD